MTYSKEGGPPYGGAVLISYLKSRMSEPLCFMKIPEGYSYEPPDFENMIAKQKERNIEELLMFIQYEDSGFFDAGRNESGEEFPVELAEWLKENEIREIPSGEEKKAVRDWFRSYKKTFDKKLNGYCRESGLPREYVRRRIEEDMVLCSVLAVDPQRQTAHQTYAAKWIMRNIFFIKNFRVLPSGRNAAKYVIKGTLRSGDKPVDLKSIDFAWEYDFGGKTLEFYATHKYTNQSGGAQDNQYSDVLGFLQNANESNDENRRFFAITDGDYYKMPTTKYPNGRLIFLQDYCVRHSFATDCDHLGETILTAIEEWLKRNFTSEETAEELSDIQAVRKCLQQG